jgi:hypothetical protein
MTDDRNTKCVCTTCGGRYTKQNKSTHRKTRKHRNAVLDNNLFDKKLIEFEDAITKCLEMLKNGQIIL